jgi:hypothetical protein
MHARWVRVKAVNVCSVSIVDGSVALGSRVIRTAAHDALTVSPRRGRRRRRFDVQRTRKELRLVGCTAYINVAANMGEGPSHALETETPPDWTAPPAHESEIPPDRLRGWGAKRDPNSRYGPLRNTERIGKRGRLEVHAGGAEGVVPRESDPVAGAPRRCPQLSGEEQCNQPRAHPTSGKQRGCEGSEGREEHRQHDQKACEDRDGNEHHDPRSAPTLVAPRRVQGLEHFRLEGLKR